MIVADILFQTFGCTFQFKVAGYQHQTAAYRFGKLNLAHVKHLTEILHLQI